VVWVAAALVIAFTLVLMASSMTIKIESRERTVDTSDQLIQAVRECWRKEPVQDCFIINIIGNVTNTSAGVPVDWQATSGRVRISREQTKVIVAPF
jgi:hypothetical protein